MIFELRELCFSKMKHLKHISFKNKTFTIVPCNAFLPTEKRFGGILPGVLQSKPVGFHDLKTRRAEFHGLGRG
jgi:hypothetical protein